MRHAFNNMGKFLEKIYCEGEKTTLTMGNTIPLCCGHRHNKRLKGESQPRASVLLGFYSSYEEELPSHTSTTMIIYNDNKSRSMELPVHGLYKPRGQNKDFFF